MYLAFLKVTVFGYSSQALTFFGLPRITNLIFVIFSAFLFLLKAKKVTLNYNLLFFFLLICVGSFLFSESWSDVYILSAKIITSIIVGTVAYQIGKQKQLSRSFFFGVFSLLFLDTILRISCYGPVSIDDLVFGSFAYKSECTIPFHDSNASGVVAVLLLSIIHLIFIFRPIAKKVRFLLYLLITGISILTASKAAVVCCFLYAGLAMMESFITSKIARALILLVFFFIGIFFVSLTISLDASFLTKFIYLDVLIGSLINDPASLLFGHGYYTGQTALSGDSEFAHILPSLMIGTFGLIGSIGYVGLLIWSLHTGLKTFIPIILFTLLALSYLPPLFDYFVFLVSIYAGFYKRFLDESVL